MHLSLLLGLGGALLASARPLGSGSIVKRSLPQCANDAVWLQLQESSLQTQASAFCSAYIEHTATQIVTVYPTTTAGPATVTDKITVDITVTETSNIIDTVTSWYSSTDIVPVTVTSVIEDIVQTTDFITTTDATAINTATDVVTTTVTDTTLTSTVVNTDDITTTDTTVYATQTATLSTTITDSTVIKTVTSVQTATVTLAQRAVGVETEDDQQEEEEEEEEEFDGCEEPEPECTSSECLYSSWLAEVSTIAASDLSSACSCLVVPATTTTTIVTTASRSTAPSIFVTATSRVTAYQIQASSSRVVVSASTIIDETSSIPLFVTRTRTSPTTKHAYATASSSAIVTRVATNDQTASTTVTSVESVTIDETASATTTITATATILETASSTVSITETITATITPTACAQLSSPYDDSAYGVTFDLDCNYEYSYSTSKIVGLNMGYTFKQCINACAALSTCSYVQYDRSESECFLLSGILGGQAVSGVDVAVASR